MLVKGLRGQVNVSYEEQAGGLVCLKDGTIPPGLRKTPLSHLAMLGAALLLH